MTTRVGRGRSRGGRILDETATTLPARGRGLIGRGASPFDPNALRDCIQQTPGHSFSNDGDAEAKTALEAGLCNLVKTLQGSVLHMTLKYFNSSADAQYYIDKVMEYALLSPYFTEKFTMSYKLITLMKTHGESVKRKMFTKLQTVFKDMQLLMTDADSLNKMERERLRNYCDLLGQLYFRLRVSVDSMERYDVLSSPVLHCLAYLISVQGCQELKLLAKLLALNLTALRELHPVKVEELKSGVRRGLFATAEDASEKAWLIFILEALSARSWCMDPEGENFYAQVLQQEWADLPKDRIQMLADIPADIVDSHMDNFNVSVENYLKHRVVIL